MKQQPRRNIRLRNGVDLAMTAALLLLMTYERIGEASHEVLGLCMVVLFLVHHGLNRSWAKHLLHGRYTPFRAVQTALAGLLLLGMLGSAVSGVMLSRHAFAFLSLRQGQSGARTLHLLCGYWNFVLMSLHLGLHGERLRTLARQRLPAVPRWGRLAVRAAAAALACYGAYAFYRREIGRYLLLENQFVFFDFREPLALFLLDYLAAAWLFVCAGDLLARLLLRAGRKAK